LTSYDRSFLIESITPMKVQQLFTGCLAEMAYYIVSNGEAAIVDPLRETAPYLALASADNAKIKYIFLTHFHADFVSGHVDLARETGASIVLGPTATAAFDMHQGKDGERFPLGAVSIELLHTPGHTMESVSYVLIDEVGKKHCVFTGDCLFIGDVGRPDLAVNKSMSQEDLAGHLFDSLRNKLMPLPDDILVYPNHGAGSACGKMMSKETYDTLGNQKRHNYALRADMSREDFIREVSTGLTKPPQYFPKNVQMNKGVNQSIDTLLKKGTTAITPAQFKQLSSQENILVIDTRSVEVVEQGTVPGAWFIGIDGAFAPWVGTLVASLEQEIIFICDPGRVQEVVTRFARVGYDAVSGFLDGGMEAWQAAGYPVESFQSVTADRFAKKLKTGKAGTVLDVRKASEYASEHVQGVANFPLDYLLTNLSKIDPDQTYTLHCLGGYRSLIASSIFKARGISQVTHVTGGFKAIKQAAVALTDYICPTTLL
jgi:glyoxylase-like metal-dependent hydrolase (beta-lactamase superfamily II)/rhodanese-related sulfurtransferase